MRIRNPRQVFAWCQELLFITICLVMLIVSSLFLIFFGEIISYHSFTLPVVCLLVCGVLGTVASYLVHYQRFYKQEQSRCCLILVGLIFICCGMGAVIYMAVFSRQANHLGNMALYQSDEVHKKMIDKTQMLLKCCGDVSYTDWFKVDWQGMDRVPCGKPYPMDVVCRTAVPFSCCSPKARPPCVHNYLLMDKDAKLYRGGCKERLVLAGSIFLFVMASSLVVTGVLMLQWGYCCHDELAEPKYSIVSLSTTSDSCSGGSPTYSALDNSASSLQARSSKETTTTAKATPKMNISSPFHPIDSDTTFYSTDGASTSTSKKDGDTLKSGTDTDVDTEMGATTSPPGGSDLTATEGDTDTGPGYVSDVTEEETGNETELETHSDDETTEKTGLATDNSEEDTGREGDTDIEGETDASETRGAESSFDEGKTDDEMGSTTKLSTEENEQDNSTIAIKSSVEKLDTARSDSDTAPGTTVMYSDSVSRMTYRNSGEPAQSESPTSIDSFKPAKTSSTDLYPKRQLSGSARSLRSNEATVGSTTDIRTTLDEKTDDEEPFQADDRYLLKDSIVSMERPAKAGKSLKWNTPQRRKS